MTTGRRRADGGVAITVHRPVDGAEATATIDRRVGGIGATATIVRRQAAGGEVEIGLRADRRAVVHPVAGRVGGIGTGTDVVPSSTSPKARACAGATGGGVEVIAGIGLTVITQSPARNNVS